MNLINKIDFAHRQLYVGCSRVGHKKLYTSALNERTINVVHKEALQTFYCDSNNTKW